MPSGSWIDNPKPCREDELLQVEAALASINEAIQWNADFVPNEWIDAGIDKEHFFADRSSDIRPLAAWLVWQVRHYRPYALEDEARSALENERFTELNNALEDVERELIKSHDELAATQRHLDEAERELAAAHDHNL